MEGGGEEPMSEVLASWWIHSWSLVNLVTVRVVSSVQLLMLITGGEFKVAMGVP